MVDTSVTLDMMNKRPPEEPAPLVRRKRGCCKFDYHYLVPTDFDNGKARAVDFWVLGRGLIDVSTAHGIPRIFLARGIFKTLFWAIVCMASAAALILQLQNLIRTYIDFKVNVDIEILTKREMSFPAVTICNMAPIKKSNAAKNTQLSQFLATNVANNNAAGGTEASKKRQKFQVEDKIFTLVSSLPDKEKVALGFSREDMIVDCEYAGYDCYRSEFEEFYNTLHGNCFVFNSGWNKQLTLRKAYKTGRRYGLKLILNVGQDEYMREIGESAGARVVVHSQSRMPFPEDEGILLYPGTLSSIGLRKVVADRAPHPHGNCTDATIKNLQRNVYEELHPATQYSIRACYKTCYQRWVIKKCSCADPYLPRQGQAFNGVNTSSCTTAEQEVCRDGVEQDYIKNNLDCVCPTPCEEELFSHDVSSAQWPSETHTNQTLTRLKGSLQQTNPKLAAELSRTTYRKNLSTQFISDIGGTFGLWLGFSAITLIEFFEFLLDLCVLYCFGRSRQRKIKEYMARQQRSPQPPSYNESQFGAESYPDPDTDDTWYLKQPPTPPTPVQENNWVNGKKS